MCLNHARLFAQITFVRACLRFSLLFYSNKTNYLITFDMNKETIFFAIIYNYKIIPQLFRKCVLRNRKKKRWKFKLSNLDGTIWHNLTNNRCYVYMCVSFILHTWLNIPLLSLFNYTRSHFAVGNIFSHGTNHKKI